MKLLFLPITLWLDWAEAWLARHEDRFPAALPPPPPPRSAEIIDLAEERRRRAA